MRAFHKSTTPPLTDLGVTLPLLFLDLYAILFGGLYVVLGFDPHSATRLVFYARSIFTTML